MRMLSSFLVALLGTSCVSTSGLFPIEYAFTDMPEKRRIELRYHNTSEQTVCLLPEFWPNQAGKINQASGEVFLLVGDRRFAIEDFNTGYCPDCRLAVAPGETVRASIGYDAFDLPEALVD